MTVKEIIEKNFFKSKSTKNYTFVSQAHLGKKNQKHIPQQLISIQKHLLVGNKAANAWVDATRAENQNNRKLLAKLFRNIYFCPKTFFNPLLLA